MILVLLKQYKRLLKNSIKMQPTFAAEDKLVSDKLSSGDL